MTSSGPPDPSTLQLVAIAWAAQRTCEFTADGVGSVTLVRGEAASRQDLDRLPALLACPDVSASRSPLSAAEVVPIGPTLLAAAHALVDAVVGGHQVSGTPALSRYLPSALKRLYLARPTRSFLGTFGKNDDPVERLLLHVPREDRLGIRRDVAALAALKLVGLRGGVTTSSSIRFSEQDRRMLTSGDGALKSLRPGEDVPRSIASGVGRIESLQQQWRMLSSRSDEELVGSNEAALETAKKQLARYFALLASDQASPRSIELAQRCAERLAEAIANRSEASRPPKLSPVERARASLAACDYPEAREWAEGALFLDDGDLIAKAMLGAAWALDPEAPADRRGRGLSELRSLADAPQASSSILALHARVLAAEGPIEWARAALDRAASAGVDRAELDAAERTLAGRR